VHTAVGQPMEGGPSIESVVNKMILKQNLLIVKAGFRIRAFL
jgi:hypothetical protein